MTARALIFAFAAASAVVAMTNTATAVAEPEAETDASGVVDSLLGDDTAATPAASLGASCAAPAVPSQLIATAGGAVPDAPEAITAADESTHGPAPAEVADTLTEPVPETSDTGTSIASTEDGGDPGGVCGAVVRGNVLIAAASATSPELTGGTGQANAETLVEPDDESAEFPQAYAEAAGVEAQPEVELAGDPESATVIDDEGPEEMAPAPVEVKPSRIRAASQAPRKESAPSMAETEAPTGPWWPAKTDGRLNLTFAGEAAFSGAIALLFDGTFESPDSANQNIHVTSKNGAPIQGRWAVATNRQMLLFRAAPGRYVVKVGESLQDGSGRTIAAAAQGVVRVAR